MTDFFLFRHGETDWNRANRMQGSVDIPLNALGVQQAEALAGFFDGLSVSPTHLVCSPLIRAQATARLALRLPADQKLRIDARLAETNLGQAEGLTRDQIIRQFGEESWLEWVGLHEGSWNARFPGGESKGEVRDRALSILHALVLESEPWSESKRKVWLLSTHGGWLRRLLHHLHPQHPTAIDVPNGCVFRIQHKDGKWLAETKPIFQSPDSRSI